MLACGRSFVLAMMHLIAIVGMGKFSQEFCRSKIFKNG